VAIQTKIISRQVERSAVKDERQRIARELHDTLEQDLTGLSMQLENALDEIIKLATQLEKIGPHRLVACTLRRDNETCRLVTCNLT
jgi:nitrate/nitrite-specific signal transduction histidine kinase